MGSYNESRLYLVKSYSVKSKVNFLDNLRLEAKFDDFTVTADQPITLQR